MRTGPVEETELLLSSLEPAEAMKKAAKLLAPVEAYCELFRNSLRDQILATQSNLIALKTLEAGHRVIEKSLNRKAHASNEYVEAQDKYAQHLELKIYLKTYLTGVRMAHESTLAHQYETTAEIKAGIYHKGS